MIKKYTMETMLRELARDIYSPTAKSMRRELKCKQNVAQSLVIYLVGNGHKINSPEYQSPRTSTKLNGYIYSYQTATKAVNYHMLLGYKLTEKGETAYAEIMEKFTPHLERVNRNIDILNTREMERKAS